MYVWSDISGVFARPVNRDEIESGYVPTQILAEAFKAEGFEGVIYESRLAKGWNIVLFNVDAAKPVQYFPLRPEKRYLYIRGSQSTFRDSYPERRRS